MEEYSKLFVDYLINNNNEEEMDWCNIYKDNCKDILDHLILLSKRGLLIDDAQSYSNYMNKNDRQIDIPYISFHIKRDKFVNFKNELFKINKNAKICVCDLKNNSSFFYDKNNFYENSENKTIKLTKKVIGGEIFDHRQSEKIVHLYYWNILCFFPNEISKKLLKDYLHLEIFCNQFSNQLFNDIVKICN